MPVQRSVTPAPATPSVQPQPTVQQAPQQIPKKAVALYSMAIDNISLTDLCQVSVTLRNNGSGINVEQHESSFVQIGQNPPMNLKDFDPAGMLRTTGQSKTKHLNEPITKDTNMIVTVTLFNGKKFTKSRFLKPTCAKNIPATPAKKINIIPSRPDMPAIKPSAADGATPGIPPKVQPATQQNIIPATPSEEPHVIPSRQPVPLEIKPSTAGGATSGIPHEIKPKTEQMKIPPTPASQPEALPGLSTEAAEAKPATQPGMNIPAQVIPKPGPPPMGSKLTAASKQHLEMPQTILQVERMGGDLQNWSNAAGTDTSVQKMKFRWKTQLDHLLIARWEVSLSPNFPYVVAQGQVAPVPPKNTYGQFYIDMSSFSATYPKPVTFYVRVQPVKLGGVKAMHVGDDTPATGGLKVMQVEDGTPTASPSTLSQQAIADEGLEPSTVVQVVMVEAGSGPVTEFNLPQRHLQVVFEEVKMVDDSDDLSGADMSFKFTVENQSKWKHFSDDRLDTGETHDLGYISITVADPPNITRMKIFGCDNDSEAFSSDYCGDDPDTASASFDIRTYKNMDRWFIDKTPFNVYADGDSLKFRVKGYYQLYCSPCPDGSGVLQLEVQEPETPTLVTPDPETPTLVTPPAEDK